MTLTTRAFAITLFSLLLAQSLFAGDKTITIALTPDGLSQAERAPLQQYLSQQMGAAVKLVVPESYKAEMEGLADGSVDFACLGAVNYVRSRTKMGVIPLVQRPVDQEFHAVFITGANSAIYSLRDLKGKKFAYGDMNSTSSHFVPYLEMKHAGVDPEHDLQFRYTGGHPVTIKLVETGIVDAGVVDETVYHAMVNSGKIDTQKVRVFFTTQAFVNYVYVARKDVAESDREKFIGAMLRLKKGENDDVLRILRAGKFVRASDEEYDSVRQMVRELKSF